MMKRMLSLLLALCIWLGAGFALPENARAESFSVYVSSNTLKVYKKVSTSSSVLGIMSYGEKMTCIATNDDWAAVENSKGTMGFCKISGLTTKNPNKLDGNAYVKSDNVPVYRRPDSDSDVMMKLKKGSSYEAVAITKDEKWVRLKNGKHYGYVQAKYLSTTAIEDGEDEPAPTPIAPPVSNENTPIYVVSTTLKVYAKASSSGKLLGTMSYGEGMTLLASRDGWSKVRNSSGDVGYCKTSGISEDNPNNVNQTIRVTAERAKVYRKPNTSAGVMQTLTYGDSYTCVARTPNGNWARLKNGKHYGYIQTKYISGLTEEEEPEAPEENEPFEAREVYILDTTLTIYKKADETAGEVGTMSFGESLTLTDVQDGWATVRNSAGKAGYCVYGGLTNTNPNSQRLAYYAAEDGVKLYSKALSSSSKVKTVKINTSLMAVALSQDGEWARVLLDSGSHAYVQMEYLSEARVPEDNGDIEAVNPYTAYVTPTNLTIYVSNSSSAATLTSLSFGESLTCTGLGEGWARVETASGKVGYCKEASLTEENPNNCNLTLYAQKGGVKVYEKATTSSSSLMTLNMNSKVKAVAISGDSSWYRLYNGSQYGYVKAKYFATSAVEDEGSTGTVKKIVDLAVSLQGIPYVYAAQSPEDGFDCSGFTYYVYKKAAGISLKRTAQTQGYNEKYEKISRGNLKVGDLVFFNTVTNDDDLCDHVGIYIGSNQFIHASSGGKRVMISSLGSSNSDYYYRTWSWGRRILG